MPHVTPTPGMQRCIDDCVLCARTCLETARHCLELGGEHAAAVHITALLDCADICQTAASFMSRGSDMHATICEACAEACIRCADACERFPDDAVMRRCAEICRRCAESCRDVVGAAA